MFLKLPLAFTNGLDKYILKSLSIWRSLQKWRRVDYKTFYAKHYDIFLNSIFKKYFKSTSINNLYKNKMITFAWPKCDIQKVVFFFPSRWDLIPYFNTDYISFVSATDYHSAFLCICSKVVWGKWKLIAL